MVLGYKSLSTVLWVLQVYLSHFSASHVTPRHIFCAKQALFTAHMLAVCSRPVLITLGTHMRLHNHHHSAENSFRPDADADGACAGARWHAAA